MNAPATSQPVRTTCPYCGVGCGVIARPDGFGGAAIQGDPDHPANFGRLCSKGSALGDTLSLDKRLLHPMMRGPSGAMERASWNDALDAVAKGFTQTIAKHGADSVAFYVSGQLLTEDYYVANKLMKGFIGSANIDTNSRLCMASSVAGHKRAFGSDTVPGCYEDLDSADLLVLTGSNPAWCHPILHQRMLRNKSTRGARIVVIDPRQTASTDEADLHLQIEPGTDAILFSGLLVQLAATGTLDRRYVSEHTEGYAEALSRARHVAPDIHAVAAGCGIPLCDVEAFYAWFCETENTVTLYSQGVNQSAQGTDKVNAIINCHLATGRMGRTGMGPFSLTGQPNAMGGREAGGLANQLAAHMGFEASSRDRVARFWQAPGVAEREGLKAVDLFDAIEGGRIKALWVMATNPAVSMPRADAVRAALQKLDLFVVSDVAASTDTITSGAHILLPAAAWGEKDGTVTNSERRITRQRAFLTPPGEARPDWWIISQAGQRMGFEEPFAFSCAADVFEEHARLSAFENNGTRDFDLSGLTGLSQDQYDMLEPVQWPARHKDKEGSQRLFADGQFFTPGRRARFMPVAEATLAVSPSAQFPLLLNTGRIRDQWHTMTRTGKSSVLSAHIEEPFVELNPMDAARFGLRDEGFARVTSMYGGSILRVRITERQKQGQVFAPIHWSAETSSSGRVGALVQPATDPVSGQPELKATPVCLAPVDFEVQGFVLSRRDVPPPDVSWWTRVTVNGGTGYRFGANPGLAGTDAITASVFGDGEPFAEFSDCQRGIFRAAVVRDGRLDACVFLASNPQDLPGWEWLKGLLRAPDLNETARRLILSGVAPSGEADTGPVVCACFAVGSKEICKLIEAGGAATVDDVGAKLKAGTNCGSCRPEIKRLIAKSAAASALTPA